MTQYFPAVAVPVKAVAPDLALSFFEIDVPHAEPSYVPMPTPRAIVERGATLVRPIVAVPAFETVNGKPVVPNCETVPENVSVEVAGVGAVAEAGVSDAHPPTASVSAVATESRTE